MRTKNGKTGYDWTNHTMDNFVGEMRTVRFSVDRTAATVTGYIDGIQRAKYTFAELGRADLATTAVTILRFYRYREYVEAGFYLDDIFVTTYTETKYDPSELALSFDASMDYSGATPKLTVSNGADSKYLAQKISLSLVNAEDTTDVTELKTKTATKKTDGTASFSFEEEVSIAPGWYYVTLGRTIDGKAKGGSASRKLYIASNTQLSALPSDFSNLPDNESESEKTVKSYLPCFLTEEEINELMPADDTTLAAANLKFITQYFKSLNTTYTGISEVKEDFIRAKTYLELKNAKTAEQVKSVLKKGGYLNTYENEDVFKEYEDEFFTHFDVFRLDGENPILSDEAIAHALRYSLAMTSLNHADRSGIEEIVGDFNDIFKLDLNSNALDDIEPDDLYAELYHGGFTSLDDISKAWKEAIDMLSEEKEEEKEEKKHSSKKGSSGGSYSVKNEPIPPQVEPTEETNTADGDTFSDVGEHWAKAQIDELSEKGIISGFADGTFRPNDAVTRAEFAVMLKRAAFAETQGKAEFSDVKADDWFYDAVSSLAGAGVINGADGFFAPNSSITREQLAVMIYRALQPNEKASEVAFADSMEISDYASEAVAYLAEKGFLSGYEDNTVRPKEYTTRAQAAKLLSALLSEMK